MLGVRLLAGTRLQRRSVMFPSHERYAAEQYRAQRSVQGSLGRGVVVRLPNFCCT